MPLQDKYYSQVVGLSDPSNEICDVAPSDTVDLARGAPKAVFVAGPG